MHHASYRHRDSKSENPTFNAASSQRLISIDATRGVVMLLMLLDHLRETWLVLIPMPDPVDARTVLPAMAIARFAASFCAPVFVALTGISAYLYGRSRSLSQAAIFLMKRGALLMAIDILYLSPLYWGVVPQPTFWLQVIWCLGLCMVTLAGVIQLPKKAQVIFGIILVCGHNLLDPIRLQQGDMLFPLWAILHQRDAIALPFGMVAKTTYPILPWLGVMTLGYVVGPWFDHASARQRIRCLQVTGIVMITIFLALRILNAYGDTPWYTMRGDMMRTVISFISMTKYPPSILFLLPTLGAGALLLAFFENKTCDGIVGRLSLFGGAPMFFYLLHLTVLRVLYHAALAFFGPDDRGVFMVDSYVWVVVWYLALIMPLCIPTIWFSNLKKRRRDLKWLRFF